MRTIHSYFRRIRCAPIAATASLAANRRLAAKQQITFSLVRRVRRRVPMVRLRSTRSSPAVLPFAQLVKGAIMGAEMNRKPIVQRPRQVLLAVIRRRLLDLFNDRSNSEQQAIVIGFVRRRAAIPGDLHNPLFVFEMNGDEVMDLRQIISNRL